jgi:Transposase, Mutator family
MVGPRTTTGIDFVRGRTELERLDYDTEIRQVICTTNAIESLNARYRRAVIHTGLKSGVLTRRPLPEPTGLPKEP